MSIPMRCPNGHAFISRAIFVGNGRENTFINVSENCPACGAMAMSISGTYSHKEGQITEVKNVRPQDRQILAAILEALKSPAATFEGRESLREVTEAVKKGEISDEEAEEAFSKIEPAFATLFSLARRYGIAFSVIAFLINTALTLYALHDSNVTGDQAHSDAQRIEQALNDEKTILRRLEEALTEQNKPPQQEAKPIQPSARAKRATQQPALRANRHERRKAKALSKKKP